MALISNIPPFWMWLCLFEWYWRRRSDAGLPVRSARELASACAPAGRRSRQSSASDAAGRVAAEQRLNTVQ